MSRHQVTTPEGVIELDVVFRTDSSDGQYTCEGTVLVRSRPAGNRRFSEVEEVCRWESFSTGRGPTSWWMNGKLFPKGQTGANSSTEAREKIAQAWRHRTLAAAQQQQ